VLDYLNSQSVTRHLVPRSVETLPAGTAVILRRITPDGKRIEKEITITLRGGPEEQYHESVRLFSPQELEAGLDSAGFMVRRRLGGWSGEPVTAESARAIFIAKKKDG
jgi:hypothetical protein